MRLARMLLVALMAGAAPALAQQPFDMSTERPPQSPEPAPQPPASRPVPPAAPPAAPASGQPKRYLLPTDPIVLEGEVESRSWAIHLTDEEAKSPARLQLSYQNAIVVAPEASNLVMTINGATAINEPIGSPQGVKHVSVDLPAGVLRPGRNDLSLRAEQRHRTDCSIDSTYELWTELDGPQTFLQFGNAAASQLVTFQDLRAIGADATGKARISIVAPAIGQSDIRAELMRLAQTVGLYMNRPGIDFSLGNMIDPQDGSVLRILVGQAADLRSLVGDLPERVERGPVSVFLPRVNGQPPTLVVTGPTADDWVQAIDQMQAPVDRPAGSPRQELQTQSWRTPNAPMIYTGARIPFTQLGIRSEQFNGRRYRTSFQFGVPSDFYAGSYGQARILLDAAYSSAVLPGSLVNIYVNGSIAATVPISSDGGAILNKYPVKVTMRHFRPGLNDITLDVDLRTRQDEACLPGATSGGAPRFAIFGTSEFVIPEFARVGQRPNLASLAGTGFPYNLSREPIAVIAERSDLDSLSAAAILLSRMAAVAGRVIPVTFKTTPDGARGSDALFIGPLGNVPPSVLAQTAVDPVGARSSWNSTPDAAAPAEDSSVDVDNWRRQIEGSWLRGILSGLQGWMSETFNITVDMLRFVPLPAEDFIPGQKVALLVSQGQNPDRSGVWTVVTAPDSRLLRQGIEALASGPNWEKLSGAVTTVDRDFVTVSSLPVTSFSFTQTQPPSFVNYRLIIANWLSSNILSFSLILVVACLLLGLFTSGLLSVLGRRS